MKRSSALIKLSREHHSGLILAQLIKSNAPKYKNLPEDDDSKLKFTLSTFNEELYPHFICEETILIPFIKNKDQLIDSLSNEIIEEHKKIYEIIDNLKMYNNISYNLNRLGIILESHIRKEERIWFEEIQTKFSTQELKELEIEINSFDNKKHQI